MAEDSSDEQSPKMRLLSVSLLEGLPAFGETGLHYNFFRYYEPDAGTTRAQQRYRARTGVCPDSKRGRPEDSSRFLSPEDQAEAIQIVLKKLLIKGIPLSLIWVELLQRAI